LPNKSFRTFHAQFLSQHGQRDAAIAELKGYWASDPGNLEVRSLLIDGYLQTNRLGAAEQLLATALHKNSRDPAALEQQGLLYLRQRRFEDAAKSIKGALQIRPESGTGHYILAQVYAGQGSIINERRELELALEGNATLLSARVELAQNFRHVKALTDALDVIDHAPTAQKQDLPLLVERGWVLIALERYTEAESDVQQALAISRLPAVLIQAGLIELHKKRNQAGRTLLEEALTTLPDNVEALNAVAYSLAAEHRVTAAIERLRRQAAQSPGSAAIQSVLGSWLEQVGDLGAAGAAYEAALRADAAYAPALIGAARLDMMHGRWETAYDRVQVVLGKDPSNVDAFLALGMVEEGRGRYDAAIKAYRRVLEIDPLRVAAKNNLVVRLSEHSSSINEALLLAQQLKQTVPDSPEVDDTVGWAYYKAGQYRSAANYFERAVPHAKSARAQYHLSMAYFALGERGLGQKTLAAAKALDPRLPEAAQAQKMADSKPSITVQ
jgi:tetratricopeptide (TPR) repeat protein